MAGQLHYVPASGYKGSDSFTYKANDGSLDSNTATVNVTVTHVNQAPVCSTVALSTPVNTAGDAAPSCTDAENDTLTYAIVAQPTHGTASVVAGQLHYVPASGYEGSDSFTYKANDGSLDSNTATVNVTVTAPTEPVSLPAVIRDGAWYLRDSNTSAPGTITSFAYGNPTDTPIFGDWNNDGVATPGVVRVTGGSLTWYLRNTNSAGAPDTIFAWGAATDKPLVGDWDGNGTDTPGLLRASNHWILSNSGDGTSGIVDFFWGSGAANEKPIVGDWDGNGSDTPGLVRAGNWWILKTSNDASSTVTDFFWGTTSETAWVVGDWNGDGSDNPGILRGNWWLLRDSNTGGGATDRDFFFGLNSDTFRVWAQ